MILNISSPFFHELRGGRDFSQVSGTITVCGCGALGANIAENLARMGFSRLRLIDDGNIETRNLSTQPYTTQQIGLSKSQTLAAYLFLAVGCRADAVRERLTEKNAAKLLCDTALIVDTFDNGKSREIVQGAVRKLPTFDVLHVGFSGDGYGEVKWDKDYIVPYEEVGIDPCDYPASRPFIMAVSAVATETIADFLLMGKRRLSCVLYSSGRITILAEQ